MNKYIKELIPYVVIIIFVILIRTFIITPIRVNGDSMDPTLKDKEIMILKKYDNDYDRFDIVVVDDSVEGSNLIKRIIALPNERIKCKDGIIYINGKKIDDVYSFGTTEDFLEIKLKGNEYFVMGDNREVSKDSRMFGAIYYEEIKGKTDLIIYLFNNFGKVK